MSEDQDRAENRRRWRRVGVVGLVLPLVAASVLIWSATGRESNIDKVPVAVVNNDTILTDPQPMAAGRSLTAALTHPASPSKNLEWTLTDQDDASAGLRNGTYYAVLTIPSDFSSSILSSGTDKPVQGKLKLVSNAAASTTVPYISQQIASASAAALGDQTTQGYLKNVYAGFNTIAQNNQKAASSASQLAGGTAQLSDGAARLDDGADTLAGSLDKVKSGTAQLADGAASVHSGATRVRDGVAGIAQGARRLHTGEAALAGGTRKLARKSAGLAGGSRLLARRARGLEAGARVVSGGARLLSGEIGGLSRTCTAQGGSTAFCAALGRAETHSQRLSGASSRLATGAGTLHGGATDLSHGTVALAGGNARVARQAQALSRASDELSSSATRLLSGATSLATGAAGVDTAAGRLVGGTSQTAAAGSSLASGSTTLASSASQTNTGAQSLSSGLKKGAESSPTYTDDQQKALAPVVSQPVLMTSQVQHTEHGNGWLIAVIVAVILWLAALVAALSRDLSGVVGNALAPVSSRRLAIAQALPVLGLGVLQAVAVTVALVAFHSSTAALLPMAMLTLLASVTFTQLALAFRLALGRVGVTLFVLFLILQLAASGNVVPLETAPGVLRALNGVMPLTALTNGASQLVSGGHAASLFAVVVVLLVWTALSWVVLVSAVKRSRTPQSSPPAQVLLRPA